MKKETIIGIVVAIIVAIAVAAFVMSGNKGNNSGKTENNGTAQNTEESTDFINNNDSYLISINGTKLKAGDKISDLSKTDYHLRADEEDDKVPARKYLIGSGHIRNADEEHVFDVTPFNNTDSSVTVPNALIGGFEISATSDEEVEKTKGIEVYGGIKIGSTKEEVEKVFGEPSDKTDTDDYTYYEYESKDVYRSYKIRFNKDDKVNNIQWRNLVFDEK